MESQIGKKKAEISKELNLTLYLENQEFQFARSS